MTFDDFYKTNINLLVKPPKIKHNPLGLELDPNLSTYSKFKYYRSDTIGVNYHHSLKSTNSFRITRISQPVPEYHYAYLIERHRSGAIKSMSFRHEDGSSKITYHRSGTFESIEVHNTTKSLPLKIGKDFIVFKFTPSHIEKTNEFFTSLGYDVTDPKMWFTVTEGHKMLFDFERKLWQS